MWVGALKLPREDKGTRYAVKQVGKGEVKSRVAQEASRR